MDCSKATADQMSGNCGNGEGRPGIMNEKVLCYVMLCSLKSHFYNHNLLVKNVLNEILKLP